MTQDEIDTMWQQAMQESIKDGEMFTRYHFAKLVAERALADPMREVQRLGQEIEQETVAWPCLIDSADFSENTITLVMQCEDYKVSAGTHWLSTTPPQRKPLTDDKIYEMYNEPRSDAEMLEFARAIEAAHGIKDNQ
jgi:hypothetical protein